MIVFRYYFRLNLNLNKLELIQMKKSKIIYLIRHGETEFNKSGIVQGRKVNASLNDKGREQASQFFDAYNHVPFTKIYTSSLKRTQETVQKFINKGIPFLSFDGLDEISWGDYDGTRLFDNDYYFDMIKAWNNGDTHVRPTNGESPEDVVIRQKVVFDYFKNEEESELLLICMHGRAIRILICFLMGWSLKEMDSIKHHNTGLYILKFEDDRFQIIEKNLIGHLSD